MKQVPWIRRSAATLTLVLAPAGASPLAHADPAPRTTPPPAAPQVTPPAPSSAGATPAAPSSEPAPQLAQLAQPNWERISEKDGVIAYRREVPGSPLVAFRGEGIINASILRVASVLVDNKRSPEWIDSLAEARTVRRISETEFVEYDHVKTPIVMKDRDFVLDTKLELDPAQKRVILSVHSVTDPLAPSTNYVRGELLKSSFVLTSLDHGTKTLLVAEIHADPKGSVAKWIVNMFQKNWPHNTIQRLREQVQKPDIQEHPRLRAVLSDKGYLN